MSVKHYKNNLAYELLIDGKYHYYGSHCCSEKRLIKACNIIADSGNALNTQRHRHEITGDEYRSRVKLIMVWEFDTPEEALAKEAELITASYENDREHCFNKEIGNNKEFKYRGVSECKSIRQLSLDGEEIATYVSIRDAERQTGLKRQNLINCAQHKKGWKTAGGFKWEYA